MSDVTASCPAQLVVRHGRVAWDVERDGAAYGRFSRLDDAIEHACALARHLAHGGRPATVSVEGTVQEIHRFQPPAAPAAPSAAVEDPDEIDPGISE